ncbi:sodium/proline symporter PutP [Alkalibacter rhizosphaerae]|uniref:Sodium/proline symporter n=1 Tax=Alkalibacter rhizosphaerae TaxID=2815577 RepID=A0A975AIE4_9FIRM|nr:sodium/proline symporter PutP [Alkalibacter rhizosphaerae]QSX08589.1 sodium/proline symporter PutP [Alkalibacter rhizosphaerae]
MTDARIHAIVLVFYLAVLMGIGLYFFKNSKSQNDYFLGGRNLNVWVTSMSAQASDMSGWLLMGLPGTAFLLTRNSGMGEAVWTAAGLAVGTYLNWLILAKKLRQYSEHAGDSITIPTFLENRFQDKTHLIKMISALFIVIFFLIYTAAQFSAGAKLFNAVFGISYELALILGAIVIVSYTFLGGFLAVCWTDLIQGILMFFAILILPILAVSQLGGLNGTMDIAARLADLPQGFGMSDWLGTNTLSVLSIVSIAAWGLGYFGQPHILTRFMGIKHSKDVAPARRIATLWVIVTLAAATVLGVIGKAYMSTVVSTEVLSTMDGERIFIYLVQNLLQGPGFAIIAGILLTAILSAIMSTADSQLLVTSSAVSEDIFKNLFKGKIKEDRLIWISRATVLVVAFIAFFIARDPNSSVFDLVSYAWAGFGAAFGPAILLSLYWRRMNWQGALAGILSGGATVLIWRNFIKATINLYELLPAFIVSLVFIVAVTLLTKEPESKVTKVYDEYLKSEL